MQMTSLRLAWAIAISVLGISTAGAAIKADMAEQTVLYSHGDTTLEGLLVLPEDPSPDTPGVLVYHAWGGPGEKEFKRARMLAELGYIAFVADIYGQGVRPSTFTTRAAEAAKYRGEDRTLIRERAAAALEVLRAHPLVDKSRISAIGYCFGGTAVLELARHGADIAGVVSFHGNLNTPDLSDAQNIQTKVLVLHGADDPYVPDEEVLTFQQEMRDAGVDWQLIAYGNAVHSFTDKSAGDDPSDGAAYHAPSDKRSWIAMQQFFDEIF